MPPSSAALGIEPQPKRMPLHCKDVRTIDMDALLALPTKDAALTSAMRELTRWLNDPDMYKDVPPPEKVFTTRLPKEHMEKINRLGKAEPAPGRAKAKSSCKVFTHPEPQKERERLIQHPEDINSATKGSMAKTEFLPQEVRHNVLLLPEGTVSIDVDASGYFDQFPLAEDVRDYYSFKYNGQMWRMRVLPMGLRHSVAIAHNATRMLLEASDVSTIHAEPYIDNVRMVGQTDQVVPAAARFFMRCKEVGLTLNEDRRRASRGPARHRAPGRADGDDHHRRLRFCVRRDLRRRWRRGVPHVVQVVGRRQAAHPDIHERVRRARGGLPGDQAFRPAGLRRHGHRPHRQFDGPLGIAERTQPVVLRQLGVHENWARVPEAAAAAEPRPREDQPG